MSESKALVLAFVSLILSVVVVYVGLSLAHVADSVIAAALLVLACISAHLLSRVVMSYDVPQHPDRR